MRSHRKALCLLVSSCFIAASSTIAFAQDGSSTGKCSFQTVNIPAPANNLPVARALNDVGGIVGQYLASDFRSHGFLLYQGRLTTFMFPGSTDTEPRDVNTTGTIVGDYIQGGSGHAFMVHSGGFHQITIPGFPNAVVTANGVNDNGDVVGQYNPNPANAAFGYLLHNGKLTTLSFPGAAGGTNPTSINNQGVIVGSYFLNSEDLPHGFMWKNGVFSNLNPPDAGGHSQPTKISNAGDIVGTYTSTVDNLQHGFSFDQGRYTKIDVPGLQNTGIDGVNKFDNVIAEARNGTSNILLKGFCSAVF